MGTVGELEKGALEKRPLETTSGPEWQPERVEAARAQKAVIHMSRNMKRAFHVKSWSERRSLRIHRPERFRILAIFCENSDLTGQSVG